MTRRAAIYVRVSTEEQSLENQLTMLRTYALSHDMRVVEVYQEEESAWRGNRQREFARLMKDAQRNHFSVVLVWALDRLSRQGPLTILTRVHQLGFHGVDLISLQEPWTEMRSEVKPLLYSLMGWVAEQESRRISERTKAGMERARAQGAKIGRPKGRKDRKPRRKAERRPVWE
ncbi:MAG: recombinase family protein [Dehalococcoidia bacterium]|nr:recombinase family protein [Dehalococcoidia bacterium]